MEEIIRTKFPSEGNRICSFDLVESRLSTAIYQMRTRGECSPEELVIISGEGGPLLVKLFLSAAYSVKGAITAFIVGHLPPNLDEFNENETNALSLLFGTYFARLALGKFSKIPTTKEVQECSPFHDFPAERSFSCPSHTYPFHRHSDFLSCNFLRGKSRDYVAVERIENQKLRECFQCYHTEVERILSSLPRQYTDATTSFLELMCCRTPEFANFSWETKMEAEQLFYAILTRQYFHERAFSPKWGSPFISFLLQESPHYAPFFSRILREELRWWCHLHEGDFEVEVIPPKSPFPPKSLFTWDAPYSSFVQEAVSHVLKFAFDCHLRDGDGPLVREGTHLSIGRDILATFIPEFVSLFSREDVMFSPFGWAQSAQEVQLIWEIFHRIFNSLEALLLLLDHEEAGYGHFFLFYILGFILHGEKLPSHDILLFRERVLSTIAHAAVCHSDPLVTAKLLLPLVELRKHGFIEFDTTQFSVASNVKALRESGLALMYIKALPKNM
ncbi:MAG: hypothetical protein LBB14_02865 [Puniceicoccales bacterium]|jgi:hypothetical protein|nr:hypothetical protein [Puniceicoccales bacterium]